MILGYTEDGYITAVYSFLYIPNDSKLLQNEIKTDVVNLNSSPCQTKQRTKIESILTSSKNSHWYSNALQITYALWNRVRLQVGFILLYLDMNELELPLLQNSYFWHHIHLEQQNKIKKNSRWNNKLWDLMSKEIKPLVYLRSLKFHRSFN